MLLGSKRCTLDLPGFKNLEGLTIACFSPNDSPQTLILTAPDDLTYFKKKQADRITGSR